MSGPMFDAEAALAFLERYHGAAPGLVQICSTGITRGNWTGRFFKTDDLETAVDYAEALDRRGDEGTYFRATTLAAEPAAGERGGADDALAFHGPWADLDIAGPGHKHDPAKHDGRDLPPDEAAAREIITESGLPAPTEWTHSGGGLYPLWLLHEPHLLGDDRAVVQQFSQRWQDIIGAAAARLGWHYGTGVGDLARVLRLPGTVNRKAGLARPCRVIDDSGPRYTLDELFKVVEALSPAPEPAVKPSVPAPPTQPPAPAAPADTFFNAAGGPGPFDALAESARWADLLEPVGWELVRVERDGAELWKRPEATSEYSARCGRNGIPTAVVHSEDAGLPSGAGQRLTMGRLFAHLHHGGDEAAAARDLRAAAAGDPTATSAATNLPVPVLATVRERCGVQPHQAPAGATNYESNGKNEPTKKTPPRLHTAAYHGLLGRVVWRLDPATEASPAAVLFHLNAYVGAVIGHSAHYMVGGSRHPARVWPLIVGPTAAGRKGESRAQAINFVTSLSSFDSSFVQLASGLSTGEGLIHRLRDRESEDNAGLRVVVTESEFGRTLAASKREHNTISHVMRDLWDDGAAESMTKGDPVKVRDAELTVIGHITPSELRLKLTDVDIAGGTANRFLICWSHRSKLLYDEMERPDTSDLATEMDKAIRWARAQGKHKLRRTAAANEYWRDIYRAINRHDPGGVIGELVARAPAYTMRLALLYALVDQSPEIDVVHLQAALACVSYSIRSTAYIFGGSTITGDLGRLIAALQEAGDVGLTRAEVAKVFSNNRSADEITALAEELVNAGHARKATEHTGSRGRPTVRLVWIPGATPLPQLEDLLPTETATADTADPPPAARTAGPTCTGCSTPVPEQGDVCMPCVQTGRVA